VRVPDDTIVLAAPPPLDPIADVAAAVAEALRFPLTGPPLETVATRGGRATIVVEAPSLPLPRSIADPRQRALAAVLDELSRVGIPADRRTVLVAGGLDRRAGRRELEELLPPDRARDFRGSVAVHDAEGDDLLPLGTRRIAPALLEADLVVVVTAAESGDHGGPAALAAACDTASARRPLSPSLLELSISPGWRQTIEIERELASRVPVVGVSLVLDHPRPRGRLRGWPWHGETVERVGDSMLRRLHGLLPAAARVAALRSVEWRSNVVAALAGPPSVAHAEALVRGVALRATKLEHQLDVVVVPVAWEAAHPTGSAPHAIAAAHLALGVCLRLWRQRSPLAPGGAVVLLHDLRPSFSHAEEPYAALYEGLRDPEPEHLRTAESAARTRRAIDAYRAGRAPHPLRPFVDWEATAPVRRLAGRVLAGGCRDAVAARRLGFVPSHSAQAAIEMALGSAGPRARVGVLLAPPYPPIVVG
jgi:hypothetical protein